MSDTNRPSRRTFLQTSLAGGAALTVLNPFTQALAAYPENNIDVVIPTRAGGGADRLFRAVTTIWKKHLNTNFQPSFYPGASGRVGYEVFMGKKEPNAYNLLFGNMGPELLNWVVKKPSFPVKDCVYFGKIDNDAACIFVSAKSKFKAIDDIVAEGKKRQLNVGTSRLAHPASIGVLALAEKTGANFNLIPLSGGKNTIAGALTGEVDFSALPASSVVVAGDATRALLIFDESNPLPAKLNNAPTMNAHYKTDLPPLLSSRAFAIHKAAIDKYLDRFKILQETLKKTSEDPALKEQIEKAGSDPAFLMYGGLEACQKFAEKTLELGEHYKPLLTGKKS
jgi:putative tricarboxylic transport membrane protein